MKILIIRFSSIGDIVLTTPVARCLKQQLGCEVHYCSKPAFKGILAENPYIDKLYLLEGKLTDLIAQLRAEKYDHIIDLHNNLRTAIIKTMLQARSHPFDKLNWQKWLLVNFKIDKMPNVHIVDRYLDTCKSLGVKNDYKGLDYFIPDKDEVEMSWLPEPHQKGYVAFAIGGQHATKKLPVNKIIELCHRINRPIVLLGGKEDVAAANEIEAFFETGNTGSRIEAGLVKLNNKTKVFNGCGKFNLNQSASLVKQSDFVFTHDTGLMHIAAAFKKKVFSIWGNTVPSFGMYPYLTEFVVLQNKKAACRPCSKIGFAACPKKHFKCMEEMVFDIYLPEA